jgi:hypothetical protein
MIDIKGDNLLITGAVSPINPLQGFIHINGHIQRSSLLMGPYIAENILSGRKFFNKKSGKQLPDHVFRKFLSKEFERKAKKEYFEKRDQLIPKISDPNKFKVLYNTSIYGGIFKKTRLLYDNIFHSDISFVAQEPYRAYIAECDEFGNLDYITRIKTIEQANYDFLQQVKYVPTPLIFKLLSDIPNISPNTNKSQLIAAYLAKTQGEDPEEILSINPKKWKDIKKNVEKRARCKFDFRKSKSIFKFINHYQFESKNANKKTCDSASIF